MPNVTPNIAAAPPKLLVDAFAAAKLLSISPRTLWSLSSPRGAIPVTRLPGTRAVRYSVSALEAFIAAQQQSQP